MSPALYSYLRQNVDLLIYIRNNPIWYRYLSRDELYIHELEREAKKWHGKTLPQRAERLLNQVKMLQLLYELTKDENN